MKTTVLVFLLSPLAMAGGLKKDDLGMQVPGGSQLLNQLTPEQLQQVKKLLPTTSREVSSSSTDPKDLEKLMEEIKKLNIVVEERNKTLEKLMKETP